MVSLFTQWCLPRSPGAKGCSVAGRAMYPPASASKSQMEALRRNGAEILSQGRHHRAQSSCRSKLCPVSHQHQCRPPRPVTSQGPEICISPWYAHSFPCRVSPLSSPLSHPTPAAVDCPGSPLPGGLSASPVCQSIPIPRADCLSPSCLCSKSPSCAFS